MESTKEEETINELKAALAELESEEGLEMFVEGHGIQSRYFAFSWQSDGLEIEYSLPYARVLSDEGEQKLKWRRGQSLHCGTGPTPSAEDEAGTIVNRWLAKNSRIM